MADESPLGVLAVQIAVRGTSAPGGGGFCIPRGMECSHPDSFLPQMNDSPGATRRVTYIGGGHRRLV